MIISQTYDTLFEQQRLFDEPLGNHGHVRTLLGKMAEKITCKLLNGLRHKTDSRADYCPDMSSNGIYFECKVCGRTRQIVIYKGRLEKDYQFAKDHPLIYVIWSHNLETKHCLTINQLYDKFVHSIDGAYIVPFGVMYDVAINCKIVKMNSKYGHRHHAGSDSLYGEGYRVSLSTLAKRVCSYVPFELEEPDRKFKQPSLWD